MVESSTTPASPISSSPIGPREVVESFLRLTVDRPDLKQARLHLTKRSQAAGVSVTAMPPGTRYTLGAAMADKLGKCIPVSVKSVVPAAGLREMTVPMVVVQEEGEWKIDLPATMERLVGQATGVVGQAMSAMGEAMANAMNSVATAFGTEKTAMVAEASAPASPVPAAKVAVKRPKKQLATKATSSKKTARKPVKASAKPAKKLAPKAPAKTIKKALAKASAKSTQKKKR